MNIDDIPRSPQHASTRKRLTAAQIEALLDGELDGDDHPHQPLRRNLTSKLEAIRAAEDRDARAAQMTPQEIVDSIPRHFS